MWNYLGFPKEYQVNKHMGKKRYLKHANLTPAEQRRFQAYLNNIEVLYAIPFPDKSEIVVLLAEIDVGNRRDRYYLTNMTSAVASSVPYPCLLVVRCEAVIKFFIFEERNNTRDAGRSVVEERYASGDIPMGNEDCFTNQFLLEMQQCIHEAQTARELQLLWQSAIINRAGNIAAAKENAEINSFDWTIRNRNADFERRRVFEESVSLGETKEPSIFSYDEDSSEFEDEEDGQIRPSEGVLSDVYQGRALDDDEPAEMLFVEFCAKNSRPLYREFCDSFDSEQEWLVRYVDVCNRYAESLFNKVLHSSAILQIKASFLEDEYSNSSEYSDEYDVDELIEMISY